MDTYVHKTMVSVASLEKIEIIRSQEFMVREASQKFSRKMIILGPKTAILGPHFWWSGGARAPLDPPLGALYNLLAICGKSGRKGTKKTKAIQVYIYRSIQLTQVFLRTLISQSLRIFGHL